MFVVWPTWIQTWSGEEMDENYGKTNIYQHDESHQDWIWALQRRQENTQSAREEANTTNAPMNTSIIINYYQILSHLKAVPFTWTRFSNRQYQYTSTSTNPNLHY